MFLSSRSWRPLTSMTLTFRKQPSHGTWLTRRLMAVSSSRRTAASLLLGVTTMSKTKNPDTGVVHWLTSHKWHDMFRYCVCGMSSGLVWTKADNQIVTCTKCLSIKKDRVCKYEGCHYYHPDALVYCCSACASDDHDSYMLREERKCMISE